MTPKIVTKEQGERFVVLGDHQRVLLTGADTRGAYTLIEQANGPGVGPPLHTHTREDETFFIVEGEVTFHVGGEKIVAQAGTAVHAPRGIPHRFEFTGKGVSRTLLTISPPGLEKMFEEFAQLPPGKLDIPTIAAICERYGVKLHV